MAVIQALEERHGETSSNGASLALAYIGLGDNDQAMFWLNKAFEARFNPSILLRPGFDNIRSDPRFQLLVHRIGLPQLATRSDNTN